VKMNAGKLSPAAVSSHAVSATSDVSDTALDLNLVTDSIENLIPQLAPVPMAPPLRRAGSDCLVDGPGALMYVSGTNADDLALRFSDGDFSVNRSFPCDVSTVEPEVRT
jgi:hypothetical protein